MAERRDNGAERTCIVTGEAHPRAALLRFALAPDATVVPDVTAKLPGRGVWIVPKRTAVEEAVRRKLFARAFKSKAIAAPDLADVTVKSLRLQALNLLSLCRKSGGLVTGFEKVKDYLQTHSGGALLHSRDAGPDGKEKLAALVKGRPVLEIFEREELAEICGKENVVHIALKSGNLTERFLESALRLAGFDAETAL